MIKSACYLTPIFSQVNSVHVNRGVEGNAYERLHDLYSSPHSIRAIKSRRIRKMQHVAFMVKKK
jgi:hypothetical protein